MLPFFVTPYPDETVYSMLCRYRKAANISVTHLFASITGKYRNTRRPLFVMPLNVLAANLYPQWKLSVENLIRNHTVIPYYAPFHSPAKVVRYTKSAIESGGKTHIHLGYRFGRVALRYCPACVEEDKLEGREAYFRCSHQLAHGFACAKHGFALENLEMGRNLEYKPLSDLSTKPGSEAKKAPWRLVRFAHDLQYCAYYWRNYRAPDLQRAMEAVFALRSHPSRKSIRWNQNAALRYASQIPELSGQISRESLDTDTSKRGRDRGAEQVRVLFTIRALGLNPRNLFLHARQEKEDLGWCVNPLCECFRKKVPVRFEIAENNVIENVAVRCLACEMVSTIRKTYASRNAPPRLFTIQEFGEIWTTKFREAWLDPKLCYTALTRQMGFTPRSHHYLWAACVNDLPLDRNGRGTTKSDLKRFVLKAIRLQRRLEKARRTVEALRRDCPAMTPFQVRMKVMREADILRKHDSAWWATYFQIPDEYAPNLALQLTTPTSFRCRSMYRINIQELLLRVAHLNLF